MEPIDTTPSIRATERSLAEEIYIELCQRVAYSEYPNDPTAAVGMRVCEAGEPPAEGTARRLVVMAEQRARLISALDDLLTDEVSDGLDAFLAALDPLYENDVMRAQTRAMGEMLASLESSPSALEALERLGNRRGYLPLELAHGAVSLLLSYPRLPELVEIIAAAMDDGGRAATEWHNVLASMQTMANNAATSLDLPHDGTFRITRELLLTEDATLGDGRPRYVARRDRRSVVAPRRNDLGQLPRPFVDTDGDGLADVDRGGRFVGSGGVPISIAPPFAIAGETATLRDDAGRLVHSNGQLVYEYVNASNTWLGGVLLEVRRLLRDRPDLFSELLAPARVLMGSASMPREHRWPDGTLLKYEGYDIEASPFVDLVHALGLMVDNEHSLRLVDLLQRLTVEHEGDLARLVGVAREISDWAAEPQYEHATMEKRNNLADDLLEVLAEVARVPRLLESIAKALEDPATRKLGPLFALHYSTKDFIDFNPADINGPPIGDFVTPVDRSQPDTQDNIAHVTNQSIMQRLLHLIHDTHGAPMCNKDGAKLHLGPMTYPFGPQGFRECELLKIDNMATFYLRANLPDDHPRRARFEFVDVIASLMGNIDQAFNGALLEAQSGIVGYNTKPTPQALDRAMFMPPNEFIKGMMDRPRSRDGKLLADWHAASIFAWELHGFFDAIRPLEIAFSDHSREDLFADMMSAMHMHWASRDSTTTQSTDPNVESFSYQSGGVRTEELTARILNDADILGVLGDFLRVIEEIKIDGMTGTQVVVNFLRQWLVPENTPGISLRDGSTVAYKNDGVTPMRELSPAKVTLSALSEMQDAMDAIPSARDAFDDALADFGDQLFDVEQTLDGPRFVNRRSVALLDKALQFTAARMRTHLDQGDATTWSRGLADRVFEFLDHPVVSSLVQLDDRLRDDPAAQIELRNLFHYLFKVGGTVAGGGGGGTAPLVDDGNRSFDVLLAMSVDALQAVSDQTTAVPLLAGLAPAFDPDIGLLRKAAHFAVAATKVDSDRLLPKLLAALASARSDGSGEWVLDSLTDIMKQVNRVEPGAEGTLSAADYAKLMASVRELVADDKEHGLERLYDLVANR